MCFGKSGRMFGQRHSTEMCVLVPTQNHSCPCLKHMLISPVGCILLQTRKCPHHTFIRCVCFGKYQNQSPDENLESVNVSSEGDNVLTYGTSGRMFGH